MLPDIPDVLPPPKKEPKTEKKPDAASSREPNPDDPTG